ncbi:MAG: hypothetical protein QJR12_16850 [Mycobacterium sp.]|uniref:hypothetical protein n=1 Tax=Mycobacterium sp. TaxID=1785 RepID=UPI0026299F52|nr:hypothetical protein [Mycobacterium sp.]MDI3315876.1 hypothetical protein [Mycobacterium sp.]
MVSPFIPGSYLTIEEYRAAPTALATNTLVPGGTQEDQDNELAGLIKRASRYLDNTARQTLAATQATQRERVRIDGQGNFVLHAHQDRVKSVDAFAWGFSPTSLAAMETPIPPSQYFIEENRILVARSSAGGLSWVGGLNFIAEPSGGTVYASWTYTAGWVTTRLAAGATAGDTSVIVEDPTGIGPGAFIQLIDGANQTSVQVAASYTLGSATVPLAAALAEDMPAGAGFTEVPEDIKEACVLATSHYIKMRKAGGFVMSGTSATVDQTTETQLGPELEQARQLALRYERITP